MKCSSITFNTKLLFSILFIFSLIIHKIYCAETLDSKIKDICLKADSSIKSFFEEQQELPEKFQNLEFYSEISEIEVKSAIKFLLLDEETINNFIKTKNNENKYFEIAAIIIIIVSSIFVLNFEIHFFLRLCFKKEIFEPSFINFYKISPFYWILYFIFNKEKVNALYKKFLNKSKKNKRGKYFLYTFGFIIFLFITITFTMTFFAYGENENSSQVTFNVLCTSIKLLNEMQNGKHLKKDGSQLIGFKNISLFLNELMENKNIFKDYFNNYTETANEIKTELNNWENYLIDIQRNLSDKNSLNYFFYNYPSDPKYIEQISCNFNNPKSCNKSLFQTEIIYNYYPYDDDSKILWEFNNNLNENIKILLKKLNIFEQSFIKSENSLNFFLENQNVKNEFSKIEAILNIYIHQILEIDKENIFDKFIYSYLSYIYSFDFILLIFLGLNTLLALLYVEYYCIKKYFFGRVVISTVFYNIIFMILSLSLIEINIFKKINIKFSYIKEISKGIFSILNENNNYNNIFNEESNSHIKNISLIMQFKNREMNNNLLNYIKYYINNENELKNLLNNKILYLNKNQLIMINDTLNEIIVNKNVTNILNNQINNFSEKIFKLISEGLQYSTNFVDLTGTGFIGTYIEFPLTYLTYINLITRKSARKNYGYKEIPCDETWNISTLDYPYEDNYFYKSKDKVLCENCINKCSNEKYALNFMEYSLEEIEQRYRHLKNENHSDTYYELMYYFQAVDKLRDNEIFDQLKDFYKMNENLKIIQNNIFNLIETMDYIAKNITSIYENIVNKYEKGKNFFNYTEFIKNDLYYLLGQIEINFSTKINKEYKKHLNINIMCVCVCFSLFIFYTLIAKEMKYYKTEHNEDDASSIEENGEGSLPVIQDFIKKGTSKITHRQTSPALTNIINIFIINEDKNLKKNKTLENNTDNDINRNKNNTESYNEKNTEFLENKNNLIYNKFKKNAVCSALTDENKNDESRFNLTKGLIIENKNENVLKNINRNSLKYLDSKKIIIKNKNLSNTNIK